MGDVDLAESLQRDISTPVVWYCDQKDLAVARRQVSHLAGNRVGIQLDMVSAVLGAVGYCDSELCRLPGKYGIGAGKTQFETDQVALTLVHRYQPQAHQQEGQNEREIVVVVHRSEQHGESH